MIIVTGAILAKPETFEEILALSLEHVERSRGEPGCLEHSAQIDAENPLRIVFFERWADAAALKAHFMVPASRDFAQAAARLASEATALRVFEASESSARAILA